MGRVYYDRGLEIHSQLEALETEMADLQQRPQGRVKITAPGLYAERWVAPEGAPLPPVAAKLDQLLSGLVTEGVVRRGPATASDGFASPLSSRSVCICISRISSNMSQCISGTATLHPSSRSAIPNRI